MKFSVLSFLISSSLLISSAGIATDTKSIEEETHDSLRVSQQKEQGILEKDRDYTEKSEFVKNRDRVEGATEQIGGAIADGAKDAGKKIENTVKALF